MNSKMFSIIIPVYNVENYLQQCVESVLSQTFTDFEIILVDDGSTDRSASMSDAYSAQDDRIKVVHKKNGGAADARNVGIQEASGTYLMFLDSDDYWDDTDALSKVHAFLVSYTGSFDMMIFQAKLLYPNGRMVADNRTFCDNFNALTPLESLQYLSEHGSLVGSACTKVIRRAFLLEHNLYFLTGKKHEDIDWIIKVSNCLPKCVYLDEHFYIYRKGRKGSVTGNANYEFLMTFVQMLKDLVNYPYSSEQVKQCLLGYIAYEFGILMAQTANLADKNGKKKIKKELRSMQQILQYDVHPYVKKINRVKKFAGFDFTMLLLGIYLKYRRK